MEYFRGSVTEVLKQERLLADEKEVFTQQLKVTLETGEEVVVEVGTAAQPLNHTQLLDPGQQIIVSKQVIYEGEAPSYVVSDIYRLPLLMWLFGGFFVLVFLVARLQGVLSMLGMGISLAVLVFFIIPQILAGQNPLMISVIGSTVIAALTIYVSHGWSLKSHLALSSMLVTLLLVAILSEVAVSAGQLVGLGSEEAYFLQFGTTSAINLQGLLLGGILLGTLGILDDITVSQISVVFQLKGAKQSISFQELYQRSIQVGKDHVASLVNTLVLAYAGANLPLFLLFTLNTSTPLWVTLSSEVIAEEIIRTLVGSIGLVMAVPLATFIAAYWAERKPELISKLASEHHHRH